MILYYTYEVGTQRNKIDMLMVIRIQEAKASVYTRHDKLKRWAIQHLASKIW